MAPVPFPQGHRPPFAPGDQRTCYADGDRRRGLGSSHTPHTPSEGQSPKAPSQHRGSHGLVPSTVSTHGATFRSGGTGGQPLLPVPGRHLGDPPMGGWGGSPSAARGTTPLQPALGEDVVPANPVRVLRGPHLTGERWSHLPHLSPGHSGGSGLPDGLGPWPR